LSGRIPVKRSQGETKYRPEVDITYLSIFIAKLGMEKYCMYPEAIVNPYMLKSIKGNRESVYAA
jgi:hypothetical protein